VDRFGADEAGRHPSPRCCNRAWVRGEPRSSARLSFTRHGVAVRGHSHLVLRQLSRWPPRPSR
jgi:hypothetical protein